MKLLVLLCLISGIASTDSNLPTIRCLEGNRNTHAVITGFHSCMAVYNLANGAVVLSGEVDKPLVNPVRDGCFIMINPLNSDQFVVNCTCHSSECNYPLTVPQLLDALPSEPCSPSEISTTSTQAPTTRNFYDYAHARILASPIMS